MKFTTPKEIDSARVVNEANFRPHWLPNLADAQRFLDLLDPEADNFLFSSFDDDKERDRRRRAKLEAGVPPEQRYGCLRDIETWLTQRQQAGGNVCCTVQVMNGRRRLASDVAYIRAIFGEFDSEPLKRWPIEPSIINESSPGKQHVYWLGNPEHPITPAEFEGIQMRIVADNGAKDIARTLRMPGTWNLKPGREPHRVRIIHQAAARYSRDDLLAAFPPIPKQKAKGGPKPDFVRFRSKGDLARFVDPLKHIPADDYCQWFSVGMALHNESLGSAEGLRMWDAWSTKGDGWSRGECEYRWRTFQAGKGITGGSIYEWAKDFGYQKPEPKTDWRASTRKNPPVLETLDGQPQVAEAGAEPNPNGWLPIGFKKAESGELYFLAGQDRDGADDWQWLSSALEITAETSDERDREHGRLIRTFDRQNQRWHEWAMPMRLLAGDPGAYRAELLSQGARLGLSRKAVALAVER